MVVVFADELTQKASPNALEQAQIVEAAQLHGLRVFSLPLDLEAVGGAESAFAWVPSFDTPVLGIWTGVIPSAARYNAIYDAARNRNIHLVNTPAQHRLATEFDQFYPHLAGLTPKSVIIDSESRNKIVDMCSSLTYPLFVKGVVKSNKDEGWEAVVAQTPDELVAIASRTLERDYRSRGKVIVRELVDLKTVATDPNGFRIGREYRAFVDRGEILEMDFYWEEYADPSPLNSDNRTGIEALVREVANRVDARFISIDVGQIVSGEWIVIEIGDGQFSGLSQISPLSLWSKIAKLTR